MSSRLFVGQIRLLATRQLGARVIGYTWDKGEDDLTSVFMQNLQTNLEFVWNAPSAAPPGARATYNTVDTLDFEVPPSHVQVGQIWKYDGVTGRSAKFRVEDAVYDVATAEVCWAVVTTHSTIPGRPVGERLHLRHVLFVRGDFNLDTPVAAAATKERPYNTLCGCGAPAFTLWSSVECSRVGCRNFVK